MNFEQTIEAILNTDAHVGWEHATAKQLYAAVSKAALARVYPQWQTTHGGKRAAYLSAEFLIGRVVEANLLNLGLLAATRAILSQRGIAPAGVGDMAALPPDFSTRLACLLWGMSPDAAKENLRALRLSNEQMDTADTLQGGRLPTEATPYAARCLRRDYGLLADALLCIAQAHGTDVAALRALVEASATAGDPVRVSDLAVDGRDLRALGVPPGRAIGEVLATLLDEVLADPTQNTKERLSDRVREMRFV